MTHIHLDFPEPPLNQSLTSTDLRYTQTQTLQTLLQQNHTLTTTPPQPPNPTIYLQTLQTHQQTYQAPLSRQTARDLPPDIAQTHLKDEPQDWYLKTADFGSDYDQILQHRDGENTQLLEDLAQYSQILDNGSDRLIVVRSESYTEYGKQRTAAMRCLGYPPEQFQFIAVQPLQLYAFHKPTQKLKPIPDLPVSELTKIASPQALRWHSLRTPLTKPAPLNISTLGQPQDPYYRLQQTLKQLQTHLQNVQQQDLSADPDPTTTQWKDPNAKQLAELIQASPNKLNQALETLEIHTLCQHLEKIAEVCEQWFKTIELDSRSLELLEVVNSVCEEYLNLLMSDVELQ